MSAWLISPPPSGTLAFSLRLVPSLPAADFPAFARVTRLSHLWLTAHSLGPPPPSLLLTIFSDASPTLLRRSSDAPPTLLRRSSDAPPTLLHSDTCIVCRCRASPPGRVPGQRSRGRGRRCTRRRSTRRNKRLGGATHLQQSVHRECERRFRLLMRTRHGHLQEQKTLGSRLGSLY